LFEVYFVIETFSQLIWSVYLWCNCSYSKISFKI